MRSTSRSMPRLDFHLRYTYIHSGSCPSLQTRPAARLLHATWPVPSPNRLAAAFSSILDASHSPGTQQIKQRTLPLIPFSKRSSIRASEHRLVRPGSPAAWLRPGPTHPSFIDGLGCKTLRQSYTLHRTAAKTAGACVPRCAQAPFRPFQDCSYFEQPMSHTLVSRANPRGLDLTSTCV